MSKRSNGITFLFLFLLISCKNTPAPNASVNNAPSPTVSAPDANDLLRTLQGKWQSEQDPDYMIEIADTRMRHFNRGTLSGETSIEVDGTCSANACKIDSSDTSEGWCFMEKGQVDAQCNFVFRCDTAELKYRAIGAAGAGLAFRKIK